jgi:acyl-coenzyme A thioesterase 9
MQTGRERTADDFRFTWYPDDGAAVLRQVVPKTYQGMGERILNEFIE